MLIFNAFNEMNKLLDVYNLSSFSDLLIISYIGENRGASVTDMSTVCNMKRSQINKICARLKEKGFVDSVPASLDRESAQNVFDLIKQLYSLTAKGKKVLNSLNVIFNV